MPHLKEQPTLQDFQEYMNEMEDERGFKNQPVTQRCLLLGEEVGELFKAVRKIEGMRTDADSQIHNLEDEIADVFIMLCCVANRYGIDMEKAFRAKEEKNKNRTWA